MKVWVVSKITKVKVPDGWTAWKFIKETKPVTVEYCGEWAEVWIKAQPKQDNISYKVDVVEMGAPINDQ